MRKQKRETLLVIPLQPMAPPLLPQPFPPPRCRTDCARQGDKGTAEEAAPMIPDDIQGCSPTTQRVLPSSLIISPGHCHLFALRINGVTLRHLCSGISGQLKELVPILSHRHAALLQRKKLLFNFINLAGT
ncbi:hypothetical protein U9M48_043660 [Paspalum notatum var. saurae]|uniref:Uncharacterized protein n=1 Tax=Paspalum notatum var. saurae TaxID=547442 RepID=A0AAQ3UTY0_PASNO